MNTKKQKHRKVLYLLLAVCITAGLLPLFSLPAQASSTGGEGTSIAIPPGAFNTGNTSTTPNSTVRISGSAALDGMGGVRIVPNTGQQRGGVFFTEPIHNDTGFSASFRVRLGAGSAHSADGFVFVMANETNQVGATGQGIGYSGIKKSIGIEFDTYDNKSGGATAGTVPHIWYGFNGVMDTADNNRLVVFEPTVPQGNISTKRNVKNYDVYGWIEFSPTYERLYITYSSSPVRPAVPTMVLQQGSAGDSGWVGTGDDSYYHAYDPNFTATVGGLLGDNSEFYVGLTAATGGSMQEITLQSFSAYGEFIHPGVGALETKTIYLDDAFGTTRALEIAGIGVDIPNISVTKELANAGEGMKFRGYWHDNGTQYYNDRGLAVHINDVNLQDGDTLTARYSHIVKLRNMGVADSWLDIEGTGEPFSFPPSVTPPRRDGYLFLGYFDDITEEARMYYNADGKLVNESGNVVTTLPWIPFDPNEPDTTGPPVLYALWERLSAGVTVDLDGGQWANVPARLTGSGDTYASGLMRGGERINLLRPEKDNHVFMGWEVVGTGEGISLNGDVITITGGGSGATVKARWFDLGDSDTKIEYNIGGSITVYTGPSNEGVPDLKEAYRFRNLVSNDRYEYGIAASDLEYGVRLAIYVKDIEITITTDSDGRIISRDASKPEHQEGIDAIVNLAETSYSRGSLDKMTFYEIYAIKYVKDEKGAETGIRLKGLPVPVEIKIPLTDELLGFAGYTVAQYHVEDEDHPVEGKIASAGKLSVFQGTAYASSDHLIMNVKHFSEFGVWPNGQHIHFTGQQYDDNANAGNDYRFRLPGVVLHETEVGNYGGFDVEGKIVEIPKERYAIDIEWGEMKFVFSVAYMWEPGEHDDSVPGEKANDWVVTADSNCYTQGNNEIIVTNRSNADVVANFDVNAIDTLTFLDEVSFDIMENNSSAGPPAGNILLERVPERGVFNDPATMTKVYLRMSGAPKITGLDGFLEMYRLNSSRWMKIAIITVTITPESESTLTP